MNGPLDPLCCLFSIYFPFHSDGWFKLIEKDRRICEKTRKKNRIYLAIEFLLIENRLPVDTQRPD
jgi:hypothetical protein